MPVTIRFWKSLCELCVTLNFCKYNMILTYESKAYREHVGLEVYPPYSSAIGKNAVSRAMKRSACAFFGMLPVL